MCIDQSFTLERNHQAQLMGRVCTSDIYVFAWLGSKGSASGLLSPFPLEKRGFARIRITWKSILRFSFAKYCLGSKLYINTRGWKRLSSANLFESLFSCSKIWFLFVRLPISRSCCATISFGYFTARNRSFSSCNALIFSSATSNGAISRFSFSLAGGGKERLTGMFLYNLAIGEKLDFWSRYRWGLWCDEQRYASRIWGVVYGEPASISNLYLGYVSYNFRIVIRLRFFLSSQSRDLKRTRRKQVQANSRKTLGSWREVWPYFCHDHVFVKKKKPIRIIPHLIGIYVRIEVGYVLDFYIKSWMAYSPWDPDMQRLDFLLWTRLENQFQATAYF